MIPILPVAGTWARKRSEPQWFHPGSPLHQHLVAAGFDYLRGADGTMYEWTTDLNGWQVIRRIFGGKPKKGDWEVGGINLKAFLTPPLAPHAAWPPDRTHILAHSHGLQVVLEACARGQKVNTLISVCSPVRSDMMEVARKAVPNIGKWIHYFSDDEDFIQLAGDDHFLKEVRKHPLADHNFFVPDGHSDVLNNPKLFSYFITAFQLMKARHGNGFNGRDHATQPAANAR
jgi:hypothetical protein